MYIEQYPEKLLSRGEKWYLLPTEIMSVFKQVLFRGLTDVLNGEILAHHNLHQLANMPEFGNFEVGNPSNDQSTVTCQVISYLTTGIASTSEVPLV